MQYYRQARADLKHVQGGRVGAGHNQAGNGHASVDRQAVAAVAGRLPHTLRVLQAPIR